MKMLWTAIAVLHAVLAGATSSSASESLAEHDPLVIPHTGSPILAVNTGSSSEAFGCWFREKVLKSDRIHCQAGPVTTSTLAATAVPVFIFLGYDGIMHIYPSAVIAVPLTVACGVATFNQFAYPGWLFGGTFGMPRTHSKRLAAVVKNVLEFVVAAFANIPLLYLNHTIVGPHLGPLAYAHDVVCMIGGDIVWMWALDFYVCKLERQMLCGQSPVKRRLLRLNRSIVEFLDRLDCRSDAKVICQLYSNLTSDSGQLSDYLQIASLQPASSCSLRKGLITAASLLGALVGAAGSIVYYNLGVNASASCLSWLGLFSAAAIEAIATLGGVFGVATAGAFNSIAGFKVCGSWAEALAKLLCSPGDYCDCSTLAEVTKLLVVFGLAVGASLSQLELTFLNMSQTSPAANSLNVLSFASGFFACYWPSRELVDRCCMLVYSRLCNRQREPSIAEKRQLLLAISSRFEEQIWKLGDESLLAE